MVDGQTINVEAPPSDPGSAAGITVDRSRLVGEHVSGAEARPRQARPPSRAGVDYREGFVVGFEWPRRIDVGRSKKVSKSSAPTPRRPDVPNAEAWVACLDVFVRRVMDTTIQRTTWGYLGMTWSR